MSGENERLISYIFLSGFLSGTVFMYSGLMMFVSGLATGIVCSRAGWVEHVYEKCNQISMKDWLKFNLNLTKVVTS